MAGGWFWKEESEMKNYFIIQALAYYSVKRESDQMNGRLKERGKAGGD